MDDDKRTILVSALSVYTELLANNQEEHELSQGKGKAKASDEDVDFDAEVQKHIRICEELRNQLDDVISGKHPVNASLSPVDFRRRYQLSSQYPDQSDTPDYAWNIDQLGTPYDALLVTETKHQNNDSRHRFDPISPKRFSPPKENQRHNQFSAKFDDDTYDNPFIDQFSAEFDDEPYDNPFTGRPVIRETGNEAGPSRSKPTISPIQTKPPPAVPSSMEFETTIKPPVPTSNVLYAKRHPINPSSTQASFQVLPGISGSPPPNTVEGLVRKPVPEYTTRQAVNLEQFSSGISSGPIPSQPLMDISPNPYDLNVPKDIQPSEDLKRKYTLKDRCSNYISAFTSRARKGTISGQNTSPTSIPTQSKTVGNMSMPGVVIPQPHERPPVYSLNHNPVLAQPLRTSQETLPPAYDILPDINRRDSETSRRSGIGSRSSGFFSPPALTRTDLSPTFTSGHVLSPQQNDIYASPRSSGLLGNRNRNQPPISMISPLQEGSATTSEPLSITSIPEEWSRWMPSAASSPPWTATSSSFVESTPRTQGPRPPPAPRRLRRATTIKAPTVVVANKPALDQVTSDAMLAQNLFDSQDNTSPRDQVNAVFPESSETQQGQWTPRMNLSHVSPPRVDSYRSVDTSNHWREEPVVSYPSSAHLGSNNPYSNSLTADEALARALQNEEDLEHQLEMDLTYAHKINNGIEDEADESNFMFRKSAKSAKATKAPISGTTQRLQASSTSIPWATFDSQQPRVQKDRLKAQELDADFNARATADEVSFLAAMRLQDQYDQEDSAWETWKTSNVAPCTSCMEDHARDELMQGGCEHGYCNACLQGGFKAALQSRSLFTCCKKNLDVKYCLGLHDQFVIQYEEMVLELSTQNPLFCHNTKCAKFLPPRLIAGDVGRCEKCSSKTCRHCRKKTHPGSFCAQDKETEAVKVLAKKNGWKTCPGCSHLIERNEGCLHMVCSRCKTEFCYRCTKLWKVCQSSCPDV